MTFARDLKLKNQNYHKCYTYNTMSVLLEMIDQQKNLKPFEENDPRYHEGGRNYYYKMEDFLQSRAKFKSWNWTIIRPNFITRYFY